MARRKRSSSIRYRTRYVTRRVRSASRGSFKGVIDGALAGIVSGIASKYVGGWGSTVGSLAVGWWRNNATLKTIAGIQLGHQLAGMIPGIGSTGGSTESNFFE